MTGAWSVHVHGVVQGVGFRPFVYRLARANALSGWVMNDRDGVELHVEGPHIAVESFVREIRAKAPPSARIATIEVLPAEPSGLRSFTIRERGRAGIPAAHISPDLPVCDDCLRELFDPHDRRYRYPYINCTNCGPRYSVIQRLPYDRPNTTMSGWVLDETCAREYRDPADRRFHAQPVACNICGPHYELQNGDTRLRHDAIE